MLVNESFCWSTYTGVSVNRSPLENVAYEFILASLSVSYMYFLDVFYGRLVDGQLLFN